MAGKGQRSHDVHVMSDQLFKQVNRTYHVIVNKKNVIGFPGQRPFREPFPRQRSQYPADAGIMEVVFNAIRYIKLDSVIFL